jgi:hypothetical protein
MLRIFLSIWLAITPGVALAASMTLIGVGGGAAAVGTTAWNPADAGSGVTVGGTGNLTATFAQSFGTHAGVRSLASHSTGKFYAECTITVVGDGQYGVANAGASIATYVGASVNSTGYANGGQVFQDNGTDISGGTFATFASGDVLGMAVDLGAGLIWFSKNGTYGNSGNPAGGTGGKTISGIGPFFVMSSGNGGNGVCVANFGATAYATAAPSGFGNW